MWTKRLLLMGLGLLLLIPTAWAMRTRKPPTFTDLKDQNQLNELNNYLSDVYDLTNGRYTLENITTDPNGSRKGLAGDLVYAVFGGTDHLCINTSIRGDTTPTDWTCVDLSVLDTCPGGSDGMVQFNDNGNCGGDADLIWEKNLNYLNVNGSVGVGFLTAPAATVEIDPADSTGVTAEDIAFRSSAQTVTLADGTTLTAQRQNQFIAPTINGVSGGSTETVTNAATVYVDGPPSGSNLTFTNGPWGIWNDCTVDGDCLNFLLSNSQANVGGSTNETVQVRFGFGSDKDVGRITAGKLADFSTTANSDAFLNFGIDVDGTATTVMQIVGSDVSPSTPENVGVQIGRTGTPIAALYVRPYNNTASGIGLRVQDATKTYDMLSTIADNTIELGDTDFTTNFGVTIQSGASGGLTIVGDTADSPAALTLKSNTSPAWDNTIQISEASSPKWRLLNWRAQDITGVQSESPHIIFGASSVALSSQTIELADSTTLTNQRAYIFNSQTLNGLSGGGTETATNAATMYIKDAPSGSNITFTNGPYALWVDDGTSRFDGVASMQNNAEVTGQLVVFNSNSLGWSVQTGADTACNTTCTSACVFGQDTAALTYAIVDCSDATADRCLCAGVN